MPATLKSLEDALDNLTSFIAPMESTRKYLEQCAVTMKEYERVSTELETQLGKLVKDLKKTKVDKLDPEEEKSLDRDIKKWGRSQLSAELRNSSALLRYAVEVSSHRGKRKFRRRPSSVAAEGPRPLPDCCQKQALRRECRRAFLFSIVDQAPRLSADQLTKVKAIEVHHLVPGRDEVLHEFLLGVSAAVNFRQGPKLGVGAEDQVHAGGGPLELLRFCDRDLRTRRRLEAAFQAVLMSSRFTKKSLVSDSGRLVNTPCCDCADVGVQHAQAADEHRHLWRG